MEGEIFFFFKSKPVCVGQKFDQHELLNANLFDIDAQQKIEEMIQQEWIILKNLLEQLHPLM